MRFSLAAASLLAGSAVAFPSNKGPSVPPKGPASPPKTSSLPNLNALAQRAGKLWFGTAADIPGTDETTDAAYLKLLKENFGEVTPANALKVRLDR